jgi:flagellar basal-body rod protein FlgB
MNVFATAERHMSWLASRQMVAASNVAHADTAGYRALSLSPFDADMKAVATTISKTHPGHLPGGSKAYGGWTSERQNNHDISLSGNDVMLEKEMRVIGENARLFNFDVGLLKSFQRMLISSVKG